MKRIAFPLLALVLMSGCLTLATKEDFGPMTDIVEVKASRDHIYDRTMNWIATKYVSPKQVIQYSDKAGGIITFNGAFRCKDHGGPYSFLIDYKVIVNIKDNKYKIEMQHLSWVHNGRGDTGDYYTKFMASEVKKEYERIKAGITEHINPSSKSDW